MSEMHDLRVSAQYSDQGEFWKVEVLEGGHVVASADRLASSMAARTAGEYLSFGLREQWQIMSGPSDYAVSASVEAVKSEMSAEISAENGDGHMLPKRFLRMIFRVIRQAQIRDFHCDDATRPAVDASDLGRYWTLKAVWPEEKPAPKVSEQWNSPQRKVIPDLRYVILALDDAKALALNASAGLDERLAQVIARIDADTGADIEDIVAKLKAVRVCGACSIEGQEEYCVCWGANKLGRRLARLVDRANADRTDGEAQPEE